MLVVESKEYLDSVQAFAKSINMESQLQEKLDYLDRWGKPTEFFVYLQKDFAPYSFYFNIVKRHKDGSSRTILNGGLIYHKPESGWNIHT
jgi:hypothetical protein